MEITPQISLDCKLSMVPECVRLMFWTSPHESTGFLIKHLMLELRRDDFPLIAIHECTAIRSTFEMEFIWNSADCSIFPNPTSKPLVSFLIFREKVFPEQFAQKYTCGCLSQLFLWHSSPAKRKCAELQINLKRNLKVSEKAAEQRHKGNNFPLGKSLSYFFLAIIATADPRSIFMTPASSVITEHTFPLLQRHSKWREILS